MVPQDQQDRVGTIVQAEQDARAKTYNPPENSELRLVYDRTYYTMRNQINGQESQQRIQPQLDQQPVASRGFNNQEPQNHSSKVRIIEMAGYSINILTSPKVETFDQYKSQANRSSAIRYVLVAAIITMIVSFIGGSPVGPLGLFNLPFALEGINAGLTSFFRVFVNFIIFARIAHFIAKSQGGINIINLVTFSFSLFWVPILLIITFVPILSYCAWPIEYIPLVFFGQIALRSSMAIKETGKAIIAVIAASLAVFATGFIAEWIINFIMGLLYSAIF